MKDHVLESQQTIFCRVHNLEIKIKNKLRILIAILW